MSNLTSVLKSEIIRLSKKEISAATKPLKSANLSLKKTIVELKKRISVLESQNKQLKPSYAAVEKQQKSLEIPENIRITSKIIKSLRTKLSLSQESFGKLLGISSNAVHTMEHKKGQLKPRSSTLSNLLALKGMNKKEVNKRLEEINIS